MKKTFPFKVPGIADPRVIESIKNDARKYVKRERRKTLPEGFDLWDFNCKVGPDSASAASRARTTEYNRLGVTSLRRSG